MRRSNWTRKKGWQKELVWVRAAQIQAEDILLLPAGIADSEAKEPQKLDLLAHLPKFSGFHDEQSIWFKSANRVRRFVALNDFIQLVAWYVTEGYPAPGNRHKPNRFGVYIAQSASKNPLKLNSILSLCQNWGFSPTVHGQDSKSVVYFSGPTTSLLLSCGHCSREKTLPSWLLSLSNVSLKLLLDTLILGDGYQRRENQNHFITTSLPLLHQVSYLGQRLGNKVSVHRQSAADCYQISLWQRGSKPQLNRLGEAALSGVASVREIPNEEQVCDITVADNHNFFAGDMQSVLVSNSVYPDCRPEFINAFDQMQKAAVEGFGAPDLHLEAPFLQTDKTGIVREGARLSVPFERTWSCYEGGEIHCGQCGTCVERREAFELAGVADPTIYRATNG